MSKFEKTRKSIASINIGIIVFSNITPLAFAAVSPSFVATETTANLTPDNTQSAITVTTQPNVSAVPQTKATRTITVGSLPSHNESITIGSCVITFRAIAGSTADETNCNDNVAQVDLNTGGGNNPRNSTVIAGVIRNMTNVTSIDHGPLSVSGGSNNATFTTTGTEISATPISFTDSTGGNVTSTSSTTGVLATSAVAQVNTITIGGTIEVGDVFIAHLPIAGINNPSFTAVNTNPNSVAAGLNTAIQNSVLFNLQSFTTSVSGNVITLTAKNAGTGFTQTSSTTNRSAVAQVVTFTPANPVSGATFRATINGINYDYAVVGNKTVAQVVAAMQPIMNAASAVTCTQDSVKVTCRADMAGVPFTFSTTVVDTNIPVITLVGTATVTVAQGFTYIDAGATAVDNVDGDITSSIVTSGTVDTSTLGTYTLTYSVTDLGGNPAVDVTRSVTVTDQTAPSVPANLLPSSTSTKNVFDFSWDASTDNVPGDITYEFQSSQDATESGGVLTNPVYNSGILTTHSLHSTGASDGVWYWQVRAKDEAGNISDWSPIAQVTIDDVAPVITLDPYTTTPTKDDVIVTASVNEGTLNSASHTFTQNGSYTFTAIDDAGNTSESTVTISNIDKIAPSIVLNGASPMDVSFGSTYEEAGASCTDNVDAFCIVVIDNSAVIMSAIGSYNVYYDATDSVGNASSQVTRVVNVVDVDKPIITLLGTATVTVAQGSTYIDAGATAVDNVDGDITSSIVTSGTVDTSTLGTYTLTYDVSDTANNAAAQVTRQVTVTDQTAPVLSEVTKISTPSTNTTPVYTFSTDEDGTITYAGGCTSTTTDAIKGDNTITLMTLTDGTYDSCTITVTDVAGNASTPLAITTFIVDTTAPTTPIILRPTNINGLTGTVEGTCEDGTSISLSNTYLVSNPTIEPCVGGTFSIPFLLDKSAKNLDITFDVTSSDIAGNTSAPMSTNLHYVARNTGGSSVTPTPESTPSTPTETPTPTTEPVPPVVENPVTPVPNPEPTTPENTLPESTNTPENTPNSPNPDETTPRTPRTPTPQTNNPDIIPERGGGAVPEENSVPEVQPAPSDVGGGAVPEENSYTLIWILLGTLAALNIGWYFVSKNRAQSHQRRDI